MAPVTTRAPWLSGRCQDGVAAAGEKCGFENTLPSGQRAAAKDAFKGMLCGVSVTFSTDAGTPGGGKPVCHSAIHGAGSQRPSLAQGGESLCALTPKQ